MKANAPENIYIDDPTGEFNDHWSVYPNDDSVEYICKDAFIEKAVKWLMDNIQDYTDDGMGEHSFVLVHDLKEHFKNYMKGE